MSRRIREPIRRVRPTCTVDDGRRPTASVNLVTVHDGFTLADLVAYDDKHNEANGENNHGRRRRQPLVELRCRRADRRPGHPAPCAADSSARCWRHFCCRSVCRCCSAATSSAGRSTATTIAYCQDNAINWFDWSAVDAELLEFTQVGDCLAACTTRCFVDGAFSPGPTHPNWAGSRRAVER